ncbi:uncharacterized protein [Physcomitrium patens]|uniref:C2H2-type domain-containing protein n=1 Tax=Physcomitrium patens TaxID=3218 RepID=A0A2K1KTB2_PHYPA|nr:zinc finger protein 10-like [Physcomitrium patens]PNR57023.1 hypothetical protein PHYPA_004016 [Physcomitrium patens]|eukprot:XP_024369924.1 zinc finger protein 10-like [Physcomitrella patens]
MATGHIMHQREVHQQEWPAMASWAAPGAQVCGGNTWSKRMAMNAPDNESWEVRAFAEDTCCSGAQWPPRSYSCSFCGREFRTAQALGGHMNVHRRERVHANQLAQLRNAANASSQSLRGSLSASSKVGCNDAEVAELSWAQCYSKPRSASSAPLPLSAPSHTADFLTSKSVDAFMPGANRMISGSVVFPSSPSEKSISSSSYERIPDLGTKPLLQSMPDFVREALSHSSGCHPSEKSWWNSGSNVNFEKNPLRLNKVMGEQEDKLDLELRLGQSSCAV